MKRQPCLGCGAGGVLMRARMCARVWPLGTSNPSRWLLRLLDASAQYVGTSGCARDVGGVIFTHKLCHWVNGPAMLLCVRYMRLYILCWVSRYKTHSTSVQVCVPFAESTQYNHIIAVWLPHERPSKC